MIQTAKSLSLIIAHDPLVAIAAHDPLVAISIGYGDLPSFDMSLSACLRRLAQPEDFNLTDFSGEFSLLFFNSRLGRLGDHHESERDRSLMSHDPLVAIATRHTQVPSSCPCVSASFDYPLNGR